MVKVVIIGAGISGSSTAYLLKKSHPSVDVTIIAKSFSPNTTSDGAAGFWQPFLAAQTPDHLLHRWGKVTYDKMTSIITDNPESSMMGLSTCYGYNLFQKEIIERPFWADIPGHFHMLTNGELKQFPDYVKSGYAFTSLVIEGKKLVPWYTKQFVELGGKLIQKELTSLSEVAGTYDVIVNCSGLGARELVNDKEIVPLRGQIYRNCIVIGGTNVTNDKNLNPTLEDKERIWKWAKDLVPSVELAESVNDWAGLRPYRSTIRNEKEEMKIPDKDGNIVSVKVVHSYGHGGCGMALHWGCTVDAVNNITEYLNELDDVAAASSKL